MLTGFKKFILRGNVVDMAVGVVIGAAFAGIVSALTKDLLMPLVAALVHTPDFSAISFTVNSAVFAVAISSTPAWHSYWSRRRSISSWWFL
jgi:large conductance mechanosensitive channel